MGNDVRNQRIGVVGLGRIGAFHTETLAGLDGVSSLVVTDGRPEVTDAVAAKYGAEKVDGVDAMLTAGVDGIVVAAATPAHASLLLAAVDAGIPVFCEKPLAFTATESKAVVDGIATSDVPVQIGFNRRFDPAVAAAERAVRSGDLGFLHTVRSTTLDPAPPPMAYIAESGGIFRDCSVHDFDVVRWIVGREVVSVFATGSNQGDPAFAAAGDVDSATVLLTFEGGAVGVVSNSRYNGRGYDCRLEVHGRDDTVVAGWDPHTPVRNMEAPQLFPHGELFPSDTPHGFFMDRFAASYRAELSAFLEVCAGTRPSPCTAQDALEVAWIAEAATESLRRGAPVTLEEVRS
ncbi:Gfo/Idh/MocA family oxidoreductase [Rhodococcus sp. BP-316]|jgi:myo-inositol 2-dehydrogenase/D-chiro-inositol 1-dehydrogenase|uniref:Gfo/Idh/MocA family protein n=1 Tax=unclassified Rhodococcus (in: high G+C Gram-positive bacteria) TaxID=192944 RepID=UPI001C9A4A46|nr:MULTISPECIES: Gfo/Idh/MocA family oxidoreductase [unclassified Rhodococcus (in: high G+C Gram-positive bacteria)]MBY6678013.1 Gfo/Idh/MocA family oxidoreductase [Rhodococcus sp. BP-332]MBY6681818.1 Gfo/Idh/MocA family oxidoreductase [Rhodococcus sp. BP-316]